MKKAINFLSFLIFFSSISVYEIQGAGVACTNYPLKHKEIMAELTKAVETNKVTCANYPAYCARFGKTVSMYTLYCPIMMVRLTCENKTGDYNTMMRTMRAVRCLIEG